MNIKLRFQLLSVLLCGACMGQLDDSDVAGQGEPTASPGDNRSAAKNDSSTPSRATPIGPLDPTKPGGVGGESPGSLPPANGALLGPGAAGTSAVPGIAGANNQSSNCTATDAALATALRPLSRSEYHRTILDLTGVDIGNLLPTEAALGEFDTSREAFSLSAVRTRSFLDVAELVASTVMNNTQRRTQILGCDPGGSTAAACLRQFSARFGRRVFRRTLTDPEITALVAVAQPAADDPDPYAGAGLVLRALLQSPKFLLIAEPGNPDPSNPSRRKLSGVERAVRLSYLLLGTTPDEALLNRAESGGLDDATKVETVARTLLADPRARTQLRSFFTQWLNLDLEGVVRDKAAFPLWNLQLRNSMQAETLQLLEDFAWTDGRNFFDVLDARSTFIDTTLGKLYGLPAVTTGFKRVDLNNTPRAGLLTQASLLTSSAGGDVTPIRRGQFIREVLLCRPPPAAPAGVPDLPKPVAGQPLRQRLESHRTNPSCAPCHALLDSLGFGLARFDEIGAYRDKDSAGRTIADDGLLAEAAAPLFHGAIELGNKLREVGHFRSCVVAKLSAFALGRSISPENACVTKPIEQETVMRGSDLRSTIVALLRSDAFLFRPSLDSSAQNGAKP